MEITPKFIADGMLGSLARWLRLAGFDTEYFSGKDKYFLAYKARNEKRLVLTRDRKFFENNRTISVFIEAEDLRAQLKEVRNKLKLELVNEKLFTICSLCNLPLEEKRVEEVIKLVPEYVGKTQKHFSQCKKCGKIYWQGTHWERMLNFIKTINHED